MAIMIMAAFWVVYRVSRAALRLALRPTGLHPKLIDLLIAEINHQRPADHHFLLEPSLIVRESSSSARRG